MFMSHNWDTRTKQAATWGGRIITRGNEWIIISQEWEQEKASMWQFLDKDINTSGIPIHELICLVSTPQPSIKYILPDKPKQI